MYYSSSPGLTIGRPPERMSLTSAVACCLQDSGMSCFWLPGCFLWTLSLEALQLIKPSQSFFVTSKSNSGAVFSISQIKVSGTQGRMPRGHQLFQWPINEYLLNHYLGLLDHIHPHGQQHQWPGLLNQNSTLGL